MWKGRAQPAPEGLRAAEALRPTDSNHIVLQKLVWRYDEIPRRRSFTDTPGGVVVRPMAGAEPAAPFTQRVACLLAQRNAAQMGADADDDQPLFPLDTRAVELWILEIGAINRFRPRNLLGRTMIDKHGLPAPHDGNPLAQLDRRKVDFSCRKCLNVG